MNLKDEPQKLIDDPKTTVSDINTWCNHNIEYVPDRILYDKQDYWATPEETLEKGAGDCEDIAILKWWILKQMLSGE